MSLSSIESTFSVHSAEGPKTGQHQSIATLLVLFEYFDALEGPFWKQIRGQGLAYGCKLFLSPEAGLCFFRIYRSPNAAKAFEKAKMIVESAIDGEMVWDPIYIDNAKASVVYSLIQKEVIILLM